MTPSLKELREALRDCKEKIAFAAVRADGVIFTAINHADAVALAERQLGKSIHELGLESDGFITSNGRYVNRAEAVKIAHTADQIDNVGDLSPERSRKLVLNTGELLAEQLKTGLFSADRDGLTLKEVREALRDCADDLAVRVEAEYTEREKYRTQQQRYERDVEPVIRARALYARLLTAEAEANLQSQTILSTIKAAIANRHRERKETSPPNAREPDLEASDVAEVARTIAELRMVVAEQLEYIATLMAENALHATKETTDA